MTSLAARRNAKWAGMYYARKRNRLQTAPVESSVAPAWGTITFPVNPSNGQEIDINGTTITFGTEADVGVDIAATVVNILAYIEANPISGVRVTESGDGLLIQSVEPGDTSIVIAASNATVSNSHLEKRIVNARVPL